MKIRNLLIFFHIVLFLGSASLQEAFALFKISKEDNQDAKLVIFVD